MMTQVILPVLLALLLAASFAVGIKLLGTTRTGGKRPHRQRGRHAAGYEQRQPFRPPYGRAGRTAHHRLPLCLRG